MAGKLYNASAGLNKAHTLMLIITAAYPEHQAEDPRIDLGRVDLYIFKYCQQGLSRRRHQAAAAAAEELRSQDVFRNDIQYRTAGGGKPGAGTTRMEQPHARGCSGTERRRIASQFDAPCCS